MHAADAHDDPKCKRIIFTHGMAGYGAIWYLVEHMRRDVMLQIARSDLELYAHDMGMEEDDLDFILKTALAVGLFAEMDGFITAPALIRDITTFEEKRKEWREAKAGKKDSSKIPNGKNENPNFSGSEKEEEDPEEEAVEEEEDPEEKKTLPALVKPKTPKLAFNPEGKTKYLDWVYLSTDQYKRVVKYYEEKGLDYNDFKEAVRELDRWFCDNPKKRLKRADDAKALMGWPLDRALQRRRELLNTQAAERRLKEQVA